MSEERGGIERPLPLRWAAAVTVVAVPGVLVFFLPIVADARLGDGEPAQWLETGARAWLACTAAVALLAVGFGYWIPRMSRAGQRRGAGGPDVIPELGLLLTVWGSLAFLSIWTMLALDGEPRWLVGFTLAAACFGLASQVHQIHAFSARRRLPQQQDRARGKRRR